MDLTVTFIGETTALAPPPPAATLLAFLRAAPDWETLTVAPREAEFPRTIVTFHKGTGFVVQCFEDSRSWSDFLVKGLSFSTPTIQVDLGGQALEQWPPELFVSDDLAVQALDYFLATGQQTPNLTCVRIDRFPRISLARGVC